MSPCGQLVIRTVRYYLAIQPSGTGGEGVLPTVSKSHEHISSCADWSVQAYRSVTDIHANLAGRLTLSRVNDQVPQWPHIFLFLDK